MAKRTTKTSKTSPSALSAKERALKALDLRKEGLSFQAIADEIGYKTESGARNAVNRLLARTEFEAVHDYRKLKLMQLDGIYREVKKSLLDEKGHLSLWAIDRLLGIMDMQARLLGLYTLGDIEAYDWRKEFKDAGLDGDELINQLFEKALEAYNNKQKGA